LKSAELKVVHVEPARKFWIRREKNLKASIKSEAVDHVAANSAADPI
jgi:hypothetical protein